MSNKDKDDERMIYLYCLIQKPEENPFNLSVKGVGDREDEVYTIPALDLAFVVSDSPQDDYETSRKNTIGHELVCEETMKEGFAVVPVRFSTVAKHTEQSTAEEKIVKLIRRRYGELHEILREMEQKDEQGLKVYWKKRPLFEDVVRENRHIRKLRDHLADNPYERQYGGRLELGTWVRDAMEEKRDKEARNLAMALSPLCDRYETNKVLIDMMVLNSSWLIHKSRVEEFDRKVDEVGEQYDDRMKFNYVGPLPPFDFVELVIHWEEEEEEFEIVRKGKKGGVGEASFEPGE